MGDILVAGLINIETTLSVDAFPLDYQPVIYAFDRVHSGIGGVGYNVAKALVTLDENIKLLSLLGDDMPAQRIRQQLQQDGIAGDYIHAGLEQTPQSVILYDAEGKRMIYTDLKTIQQADYPASLAEQAFEGVSLAVLCNINFSRPLLHIAQKHGTPIATDIHVISNLHDDYNRDYMAAATILFQSHEHLPVSPETWAQQLIEAYSTEIIVIGMGEQGALLSVKSDNFIGRFPARQCRPIVNTVGAGDALFSAFVHSYHQHPDPYQAIQKAIIFASYKIGESGGSQGFMNRQQLNSQYQAIIK